MDITQSQGKSVGIPVGVPYMKVSVHKDNAGALILARNFPPTFTPHSKYYTNKTILFCEEINKTKISLLNLQQLSIWETSSIRFYLEKPLNTCRIKSWVGNYTHSLRT